MNPCNGVTDIVKLKIIRVKVIKISYEDIAGTHPYLCVDSLSNSMCQTQSRLQTLIQILIETGCASFVLSRVYIRKIWKLEKVLKAWSTAITDDKREMAYKRISGMTMLESSCNYHHMRTQCNQSGCSFSKISTNQIASFRKFRPIGLQLLGHCCLTI